MPSASLIIPSSLGHLELAAETYGEQLEISVIRGARVQTIAVCLRSGRVHSDAEGWEAVDLEPVPNADPPSGGGSVVASSSNVPSAPSGARPAAAAGPCSLGGAPSSLAEREAGCFRSITVRGGPAQAPTVPYLSPWLSRVRAHTPEEGSPGGEIRCEELLQSHPRRVISGRESFGTGGTDREAADALEGGRRRRCLERSLIRDGAIFGYVVLRGAGSEGPLWLDARGRDAFLLLTCPRGLFHSNAVGRAVGSEVELRCYWLGAGLDDLPPASRSCRQAASRS